MIDQKISEYYLKEQIYCDNAYLNEYSSEKLIKLKNDKITHKSQQNYRHEAHQQQIEQKEFKCDAEMLNMLDIIDLLISRVIALTKITI